MAVVNQENADFFATVPFPLLLDLNAFGQKFLSFSAFLGGKGGPLGGKGGFLGGKEGFCSKTFSSLTGSDCKRPIELSRPLLIHRK